MWVGVVSDTHNNIKNIKNINNIFNNEEVDIVIHTGDITQSKTLRLFSNLSCPMIGVFGNNDRSEIGLEKVCKDLNFVFKEPPFSVSLKNKKIAIFHEPDLINDFIKDHQDVDIVLHGHTHRYREEVLGNTIYFNPGESSGLIKGSNALGLINLDSLEIRRIFF